MSVTSELIVRIGANADKFNEEFENVKKTTKNLEKQLGQVAKISGIAFTAGAAAIGAATIAAGKFESKFTDVVTLLDKGSFKTMTLEQGIASLREGVLKLGQDTGESFDDLNKALFDLISAGVPADEAMDTLRVTTELAAAGTTDTATAVQALTATMTSFGEKAGTASEISEKFFTAQKFGVTTVGDLAQEFSKVAGSANALGISFDETLASLSSLTADGAKNTAVAATQMKAAITSIINVQKNLSQESEAVQQALSLQNIQQKGLVGALSDLKVATGGNVVEMQRLLGSSEALSVALSLTGAQSDLVKKQMSEMADEQKRAGVFADALKVKQENSARAIERFKRVIETAAIVIGDQFAPIIAKAAELLGGFFQILVNNPVLAKTTALVLGLGTAFAGIATAGALAATAFLKIRAAMVALNVTTKVLAIGVKGLVGATGLGLLLIVASEIYNNWSVIWPAVVKIFAATTDALKNIGASLGKILKGIFTFDSDAISEGMSEARDAVSKGLDGIIDAVKSKPELSDGVKIPVTPEIDLDKVKENVDEANKVIGDDSSIKVPVVAGAPGKVDQPKSDIDSFKNDEGDKTKFLNQEQKQRIRDNQAAIEVIKKQRERATQEEIDLIKRKAKIENDEEKAKNETNKELRDSELALVRAQKEQLIEDEKRFAQRKRDIDIREKEEKAAFQEEFDTLTKEQQALFYEEELESYQDQILTKQEIEKMEAERKLQTEIAQRNQYMIDEKRHGAAVAKLNMVLASERVQLAKQTANELVQLTQSKNDALKNIGKAAAVAQIGIDTAQGAASIFAKLNALVPLAAPAIGAVGAAAIIAFGAEKTANVLAANTGGMVPRNMGVPGTDSVNALLTPGELVVPEKNFDEVVGAVASSRSGSNVDRTEDGQERQDEMTFRIEIEPKGELAEFIEKQIVERRVQGVSIL